MWEGSAICPAAQSYSSGQAALPPVNDSINFILILFILYLVHAVDHDSLLCVCQTVKLARILLVRGAFLPHLHPRNKIMGFTYTKVTLDNQSQND